MIPNRIFLCDGPISCWEPDEKYIYSEWQEEPQPEVENIAYLRADKVKEILNKAEKRLVATDKVAWAKCQSVFCEIKKEIEAL